MNVPDYLAEALRAAADAAPPHAGDLAAVRHRGRARRRHRAVTTTGLVAVAVAVTVGTPFALVDPEPERGPVTAPPASGGSAAPIESAAPDDPAQPLLLDGSGQVPDAGAEPPDDLTATEAYQWYRAQPDASGVIGPLADVRPGGPVLDLFDPFWLDSVQGMVATPDRRLVLIGPVDLMPGVERTDGPCVEGIELQLLVVEPDGVVTGSRDVRVRCQTLRLVAADPFHAYLLRDDRLVAHDLATGEEQVLLDSAPTAGPGLDYAGGRLAMLTHSDQPGCGPGTVGQLVVRAVDVATGATTDHPVVVDGCAGSGGPLRLSPDGRYAGYGYLDGSDTQPWQLRLAILDLDRGALVEDRAIAEVSGRDLSGTTGRPGITIQGATTAGLVGLAWDDPQTLRLAWYEVPSGTVHWLPDVVQQTTVTVSS